MTDLPGGFEGAGYRVPANELPLLAEILRDGRKAARANGAALPVWLEERCADLDRIVDVLKAKRADVVADVVADLAPTLQVARVGDVSSSVREDEIGLVEFAAHTGVTRQAALGRVHRGTVPGARQNAAGHWRLPRSAVESA
jgi:hypothetical protein